MTFEKFMADVNREQKAAAAKFPEGKRLFAALIEEIGEAAEALLKIEEDGELSPRERNQRLSNVYKELVQVASTAYRLAAIGDKHYGYSGMKCDFPGCNQPAVGGPCAICYE